MAKKDKRYSIGEIAELCDVSTWQMRYYDKHGILSPDFKDDGTNYRYYSRSKMEEILLMTELKRIGVPLKQIAALLNSRNLPVLKTALAERIGRAKEEVNAARQKYEQTVELFLQVSRAMDMLDLHPQGAGCQAIGVVDVPVHRIVYTRRSDCLSAQLGLLFRRAELYKIINKYNLAVAGANMAIIHSNYLQQFNNCPEDSEGDLEMCVNVTETRECCPHCRNYGGFKAVTAVHVGDYYLMEGLYRQMEAWTAANGLELSGAAVEEYIAGPTMTTNKDCYVTRIYLPLKGSIV